MRTPIFLASRRDIFGILLAIAVGVIVVVASVKYPDLFWQHGSRNGFGTDWDCQYVPKSEPVCIRRAPKKAAD